MIKTFRLWRKDPAVSAEEFKWRWLTQYGAAQREAARYSTLERVTASFLWPRQVVEYAPGHQLPIPTDFDAIESLYFKTIGDLREALGSGVLTSLESQLREFATPNEDVPFTVTLEEIMGDSPDTADYLTGAGDLKLFRIISRKRELDRLQFRLYWHNNHGIIEAAAPFVHQPGTDSRRDQRHLRTAVAFNFGLVIVDGELRPADDFENEHSIDCTNEHWYSPGSEPWIFYETTSFPAEIRADEMNFINFESPVRRVLMGEYEIVSA